MTEIKVFQPWSRHDALVQIVTLSARNYLRWVDSGIGNFEGGQTGLMLQMKEALDRWDKYCRAAEFDSVME